jgi:Sigma-70, region 4
MKLIEQRSYDDIAESLEISPSTARAYLANALRTLAKDPRIVAAFRGGQPAREDPAAGLADASRVLAERHDRRA